MGTGDGGGAAPNGERVVNAFRHEVVKRERPIEIFSSIFLLFF